MICDVSFVSNYGKECLESFDCVWWEEGRCKLRVGSEK
jgi:hypothetical protein